MQRFSNATFVFVTAVFVLTTLIALISGTVLLVNHLQASTSVTIDR